MPLSPLDQVTNNLDTAMLDAAEFEAQYGKRAVAFLRNLPGLFRLYRRLPYDFELPTELRRLAAAIALYIAEHQDFLDDASRNVGGLIDDLWLAYAALPRFLEGASEELVERHWRSDQDFSEVLALAENASDLKQHVPSKVLERLNRYLDDATSP